MSFATLAMRYIGQSVVAQACRPPIVHGTSRIPISSRAPRFAVSI
jgi:hypothetical protein